MSELTVTAKQTTKKTAAVAVAESPAPAPAPPALALYQVICADPLRVGRVIAYSGAVVRLNEQQAAALGGAVRIYGV